MPRRTAFFKADILANLPDEAAEVFDVEPTELVAAPSEPESVKVNVNAPERITVMPKIAKTGTPITYHFNAEDIVQGGAKSKFKANIEAIKTLQKIESENRYATPEEQSILAGYEIVIKEQIKMYMTEVPQFIPEEKTDALMASDNVLNAIYEEWRSDDDFADTDIEVITDCIVCQTDSGSTNPDRRDCSEHENRSRQQQKDGIRCKDILHRYQ